ncbi:hypothetical protein N7495_001779 [Penicillium taxi]|uniref:uncharacterized protein n=1 Tax=Penicillium taxi TaxID=168475 RepID=UPI0025454940|nr:uncharacterized protein N7495_001779 [Penicillium taxi]KAJ5909097.1 hypothetical protein N7495_001779 [Penicillium taxi]
MDSSAPLTLDALPPECLEDIVKYLDLNTIKALRISNHNLHVKCTGPRFKSFLHQYTIDLTRSSLLSFQDLIVHPLGSAVKSLTIMALIYDQTLKQKIQKRWQNRTPQDNLQAAAYLKAQNDPTCMWLQAHQQELDEISYEEAVAHLTVCLKNIQKLDIIELDAAIIQAPSLKVTTDTGPANWYPVWMRAARNYCITMEAIALSDVRLKSLSVYQIPPRCSVPLYDIATNIEMLQLLDPTYLQMTGKHMEQLALSISTKVITGATERPPRVPVGCHQDSARRITRPSYVAGIGGDHLLDEEKFDGLARFLKLMPNLRALELHFYSTLLEQNRPYNNMFDRVAKELRFPLLRQCSLRGIHLSEGYLLQFLSNHSQITDLTLCEIEFEDSNSWVPIFAHLSLKMPHLSRLYLATLSAADRKINLHPVWENNPSELMDGWVPAKEFSADDIRRGLEFRTEIPQRQGSVRSHVWWISVEKEYRSPWLSNWNEPRNQPYPFIRSSSFILQPPAGPILPEYAGI